MGDKRQKTVGYYGIFRDFIGRLISNYGRF